MRSTGNSTASQHIKSRVGYYGACHSSSGASRADQNRIGGKPEVPIAVSRLFCTVPDILYPVCALMPTGLFFLLSRRHDWEKCNSWFWDGTSFQLLSLASARVVEARDACRWILAGVSALASPGNHRSRSISLLLWAIVHRWANDVGSCVRSYLGQG